MKVSTIPIADTAASEPAAPHSLRSEYARQRGSGPGLETPATIKDRLHRVKIQVVIGRAVAGCVHLAGLSIQ
jgi:hypothetical protein